MDPLPGPARRLAEELDEDRVALASDPQVRRRVIEELDHARRIPVFEGRRPLYGSFVVHPGRSLTVDAQPLDVDMIALDHMDLASSRAYADGRSTFLVHQGDGDLALACFDRPIQYEADLVHVQELTGAEIVQRTVVLGAVRLFTRDAVVVWDGRNWNVRPTATAVLPSLEACAPDLRPEVARGVLDLAVLVTAEGRVDHLGVGLLSTADADAAITDGRGMRHRSAHRFSFDQPSATVVVVSEDGPVTIFRRGRPIHAPHPAA
jgi:hypothetical protein